MTFHFKFGSGMGQKNTKGTVSINNTDGRIRLRWRYRTIRYSINLNAFNKVMDAFRNNTCCSSYTGVKHSHYYPFIYFLFKTGVRNAEAIGLRVGSIDRDKKVIHIREVLARSLKSTCSALPLNP